MFLCGPFPARDCHALARHVRATHGPQPRFSDDVGWLLVSGRSATDAALDERKESNLRFAMSEVSKLKPIAACRMNTAQAQHPFAISVNLVNDHAFDTQL
jgi:hypothetical protein